MVDQVNSILQACVNHNVCHLTLNFLSNILAGIPIFLAGIYWDQIRSCVKRDLYWLKFILGKLAVERGTITITLDTYSDLRLHPELQRRLGIPPLQNTQRFYKIFPNGHITWFPGAYELLMGYCSARAAGYLTEAFSHYLKKSGLKVKSDEEIGSSWENTFINLGSSYSNIKTDDIKRHPKTKFYLEDGDAIKLKDGNIFSSNDGCDKGMILKINNPYFVGYNVVVCAGIGEWGTSGAAWYLSRNWKRLAKKYKGRDFIAIVSVRPGSDESSQEIYACTEESWKQKIVNYFKEFETRKKKKEIDVVGEKRSISVKDENMAIIDT